MMVRAGSPGSTNTGRRMWAPEPETRALLDAVPSALAVIEGHGQIAYANAAWKALMARTATFGDLGSLVTPADHDGSSYAHRLAALEGPLALPAHRLARALDDALHGRGQGARVEYRMRRPDGEEAMEAAVFPLPSESGRLAVVLHLDVSERDHGADATQAALKASLRVQELEASARRMRRRIEAASRDLHNPITPVRLELHLLARGDLGPLTDAQKRALDVIARNVQRWVDSEQAFLRMMDEGWLPAGDVDLAELAREASEGRRTHALKQGIRLVLPERGHPLPVQARPDVVADVLDQFLRAAIDASPSGSTVAVETAERDGEAVVEVRDSGPGLSPRDLRGAFEPWHGRRPRFDAPDDGLHHARLAIEQAGGRVYAESDGVGAGTLLGVAFPLRPRAA